MAAPQRSKQEEIKATIYALVQEKQKVLYDKEQIQQLCEIKGKNWVTRSVNLLIQEGAIRLASKEEEEYLICPTQEKNEDLLREEEIMSEEEVSISSVLSSSETTCDSDPIIQESVEEEGNTHPRLEQFLDLSNLSKRMLSFFIHSQIDYLQTTFEKVKSFFGLSNKQLERALDELTFNQFIQTSNFQRDIEFRQESIEGIEHHLKKIEGSELKRFNQTFQPQSVDVLSSTRVSKGSLLKAYESDLSKRKQSLEEIKAAQTIASITDEAIKTKTDSKGEKQPISTLKNRSLTQVENDLTAIPQCLPPSPSTPRPFLTRIRNEVQPEISQTLHQQIKTVNSPKKWAIPTSDYSERFFLIYHQHLLELSESFNDMLTSNDTLVLVMSEESGKRKINLNQLHLILTAPWKLETWKIPMDSEEESAVLNHAIVSELSLQLILHPNAQFFVLSNSEGFLTAIHHLKQRLKLKDDQVQLLPSFYES